MRKFFILLAALVFAGPFIAWAAPPDVPAEVNSAFEKAGVRLLNTKQPIKDFNLALADGGNVRLSNLKGKVVFINFWATWCGPCVNEMPSMEVLYRRFRDQGLEFVAVDVREEEKDVARFLDRLKLTFPVALDESGKVGDDYKVQAIPSTFIVGRDGKIIIATVGSRKWDTPAMLTAFDTLLRSGQ